MKFKESENLELKKSTSELKEAIISISAILNKHGKGILYFGIKNDGSVVGQIVGKDTIRDISKAPQVTPQVELSRLEARILKLISDNPKLSRNRISKILKISSDTVKEYIKKLRVKGVIRRIGRTREGYWEVVKE